MRIIFVRHRPNKSKIHKYATATCKGLGPYYTIRISFIPAYLYIYYYSNVKMHMNCMWFLMNKQIEETDLCDVGETG